MNYYLIILLIICCIGVKIRLFQPDYMSIPKTTAIKGLFAVLIFLSHARQHCQFTYDEATKVLVLLGQMVVVMFLFYSGFGIMKQYEKRGESYLVSFLKNRVLKLLVHFDLAVLIFLIVQTFLGNRFSAVEYIFCWIAWFPVGNSCWFIFVILVLYLLVYLSLSANAKYSVSKPLSILLLCLSSVVLWLILKYFKQGEPWWYNTIIAFPLGAVYSLVQDKFDGFHNKRPWLFLLSVILCTALCYLLRKTIGIDPYGLAALVFALAVVGGSSVLSIDNCVLRWLGNNCFQIYILQRLPLIVLEHFGLNSQPTLFFCLSFVITLLLAFGFHKFTDRIDGVLFK